MKFLMLVAASLLAGADAFTLPQRRSFARPSTARSFGVDPVNFLDQLQSFQDALTSFSLADASEAIATAGSAVGAAASDASQAFVSAGNAVGASAADVATEAAATAAKTDNGWFGFLTVPIMGILQIIHSLLVAVGVSGNAWGVSIIAMTIIIKLVTYPLTKTQLESTTKMQAMQPAIKELQAKYQSNPEVMNQKIAEFYQQNDINPLAGCLPAFAQIPIFIGLYRAVLDLAAENKLNEPFLWLPNLEGPTYGADPATASDWILKGWHDGVPSLGWDDTISFLILPVLLIVSQYVSMELMTPKSNDPAQQQSNAILKVLPIMIGWFSLNVPAALCVYWFINNIVTTGLSIFIKNSLKVELVTTSPSGAATAVAPPKTIFTPPREKPVGFAEAAPKIAKNEIKTITAVVDAEVVSEKKEAKVEEKVVAAAAAEKPIETTAAVETPQEEEARKKRSGKKKRKKGSN